MKFTFVRSTKNFHVYECKGERRFGTIYVSIADMKDPVQVLPANFFTD